MPVEPFPRCAPSRAAILCVMRSSAIEGPLGGGYPLGAALHAPRLDPAPHLRPLLDSLERGERWESAFDAFWIALTGAPRPEWPPTDGRVNWIWLTDLEKMEQVIDIGSAFGDVAGNLAGECSEVSYVGAPGLHGTIVERRFRDEDEWISVDLGTSAPAAHSEGADCVVFVASEGWEARLPHWIDGPSDIARQAGRLLRPGGWFAFLGPNPLSEGHLRSGALGLPKLVRANRLLRTIMSGLRQAGFSHHRRYAVSPDHELPVVVVPHDPRALRAWGALTDSGAGWRGRLPAPLRALPFDGTLVLARR